MTVDLMRAPFPLTYRELWLPRGINGNATLPSSRYNGHELAFTGARKGTTCDGVRGAGANTSNINYGAIHDNAGTYWLRFRFKLDQPFSAAAATDQYLWGKFLDATHFLWLVLKAADGKLYFEGQDGGGNDFSIAAQDGAADIDSWNAGQWYNVIDSISAANQEARLIVDNGTVITVATAIAFPNGGDFCLLDYDDPGAGTGFEGIEADVVGGTDDLTANEEADLNRGIPPAADAVNSWLLDEGRGVTSYDRGSGADNGTLDTTATWAWGNCRHPIISLDGINDHAQSSAGVDASGAITMVWAGKFKARYDGVLDDHYFLEFFIDNTNHYQFNYNLITGDIRFLGVVGGASVIADLSGFGIEIDDYGILIGTVSAGGVMKFFANGRLHDVGTGLDPVAVGGMTAYIGAEDTPAYWDVSKPLMVGLIDGAFTDKEALVYSRWLDNILNMGIGI